MSNRSLFAIFLVCLSWASMAQSTNISGLFTSNFAKAERMYLQQGYRNAIDLYRLALQRDPGNRTAKARVADCYYRMGQFDEANRWYRQLVKQGQPSAIEYYQLGQVLSSLERYDSARMAYEQAAAMDSTDRRAKNKVEFVQIMSAYHKDPASYSMNRQWYNSPESDFSPRHFGKGIVFVSSRDRDLFIKRRSMSSVNENEGLLNAFYVDNDFDSARSVDDQVSLFYSKALNSPYHDGPVTFFSDGKRIAYTRNLLVDGKPAKDEWGRVNLELYFATLGNGRSLTNLEAFPYNSRSYSIAHPWVSEDGSVLYFSSNMPGGKGGADLYASYYRDGKWSQPENLGEGVNTAGDEFSPYFWQNQLFFASDGFGGFGGLDNYIAIMQDGKFMRPENLGFPLNSSHDDFGMIIDGVGREGYFASNRLDRNDDIYKFRLKRVTVVGHVRDLETREPVPHATISISGEGDSQLNQLNTDEQGNFRVELDLERNYRFHPAKEGYTSLSDQQLAVGMASIIPDTLEVAIWKNGLFAKGVVYSNELQSRLPGAMVYIQNLSTGVVDSIKVGDDAEYRFLVLPNMSYRVNARYPGYLENGFALNTSNLFHGNLLNDILLEETYQEKLTVFFDLDKAVVRPEFGKSLDKLVRSLNRFKGATLYVGAHADAQGSREYNKRLSDRRAAAIVAFFKEKGIQPSRMEAFGFGEELILNTCSDGVECSDAQHSQNRRAEVKVQLAGSR